MLSRNIIRSKNLFRQYGLNKSSNSSICTTTSSSKVISSSTTLSSSSSKLSAGIATVGLGITIALKNKAFCDYLMPIEKPTSTFPDSSLFEENNDEIINKTSKTFLEKILSFIQSTFTTFKHFLRYFNRYLTYTVYSSPLIFLLPANYVFGSSIPQIEQITWSYLIWAISRLGPCFIKAAQWASSRPDLFSPGLIEHLISLQDNVNIKYDFEDIKKNLINTFGENFFNDFYVYSEPIGTGSVAQVYEGYRINKSNPEDKSDRVAIKMIHPHIEELIKVDMDILNTFAFYFDRLFPQFSMIAFKETCSEFSGNMKQQLDLRYEANHLYQFINNFSEDKSWVEFPTPIQGYVSKNILMEKFLEAKSINYYMNLEEGDDSQKTFELRDKENKLRKIYNVKDLKLKLSDLGCRLVLKMVFFDNFIHGDLHPGNILVTFNEKDEPKLIVLDSGIVYYSKSEAEHKILVDICFAFMQHDGRKAGELMLKKCQMENEKYMNKMKNNIVQNRDIDNVILNNKQSKQLDELLKADEDLKVREQQFCNSIQKVVDDSEHEKYFEHMGEYFTKICDLARIHHVRFDPGYFKIAMSLKVIEGISLSLNRDLDLVSACVPIVLKARTMRKLGLMKFPTPEDDEKMIETVK